MNGDTEEHLHSTEKTVPRNIYIPLKKQCGYFVMYMAWNWNTRYLSNLCLYQSVCFRILLDSQVSVLFTEKY